VILVYFVRRRRDVPFPQMFWLFGAFIVSCGFTHFLDVVTTVHPIYRLSGLVKLITGVVSWATVLALVPITPRALAMRSPEELLREIAERKRAEEALRQIQLDLEHRVAERTAELERANREKDEFLATLAHELRNPLAPIRNALQILRQPDLAPTLLHDNRVLIDRQLGNLVRLVDDLLDVSRLTRGKVQLRSRTIELAQVVAASVETVRPLLETAGHQLTLSLPPDSLPLEADPTRLEQVFANLLNNAAKYTQPGGRIWLNAERSGQEVVVVVRDTGVGITADLLPRIFDLFTQAERSLDRAQGGLGIGLTLVRQLVEMHGGSVTAASVGAGHGSEFTVRLPLKSPQPRKSDPALPVVGLPDGPSRTAACKVLVVDDNTDAVQSLALLLRMWGHEVRVAHDGPTALALAAEFQPEAVLLDIGLPGMDGYEVARRLRQHPGTAQVLLVAITGYGQEDDRLHSQAAGFDQHLIKPVDPNTLRPLLATIRR
jgi:signal transduction histidine kinase/CheY-like chemotaxis protein